MENKEKIYKMNIHKAMRIPARIFKSNDNLFVTDNPRNTCILEFYDNLWLPFLE